MSHPSRNPSPTDTPSAGRERPGPQPAGEARSRERRSATAEPGQYLTFRLGDGDYGVPVLKVREILEYSSPTPIPLTPPWIQGVLNLRGNVVPVIELGLKFGMPAVEITDRTCIVIVEVDLDGETSVMGVIVDAVSKVVEVGPEALEAPPQFGTRVRVDYLTGMGKFDGKLVPLLDADRVLSTEELMQTLEATPAEPQGSASEDAG